MQKFKDYTPDFVWIEDPKENSQTLSKKDEESNQNDFLDSASSRLNFTNFQI